MGFGNSCSTQQRGGTRISCLGINLHLFLPLFSPIYKCHDCLQKHPLYHRLFDVWMQVDRVGLYDSIPEPDDPMGEMRDIILMGDHNDGVSFLVKLVKQAHDVVG